MTSPYNNDTPEEIKAEMLRDFEVQGVDLDTREGSYTNTLVSVMAYQLWKFYQYFPRLLLAAFPDETAGEFIDRAAYQVGMTRKAGSRARADITVTGQDGVRLEQGTALYDDEAGLRFLTLEDAIISGGTATVEALAAAPGAEYNVPAGSITALYINVPGVTAVTNEAPAQGGTNTESDADFFRRYHERMSLPITSGNKNHYTSWAREVPGVAYATCTPLWAGNGTVLVTVGGSDRGPVDEDIRAACAAHIEAERPIGATVTVQSVVRRVLPVTAAVTLLEGYTVQGVAEQLRDRIGSMLARLEFGAEQTVPYSRFLGALLSCEGVADYSTFTVDGKPSAVALTAKDAPQVGDISVTET